MPGPAARFVLRDSEGEADSEDDHGERRDDTLLQRRGSDQHVHMSGAKGLR
ncbi:hypothetical protein SDC9_193726 [bioreactor metagenome]|uniref:Uncharacterized protein n=1 Tax=bioreactor metagenome TaxID=1076179 RepID=A0A645IFJ3_9ZZZZ